MGQLCAKENQYLVDGDDCVDCPAQGRKFLGPLLLVLDFCVAVGVAAYLYKKRSLRERRYVGPPLRLADRLVSNLQSFCQMRSAGCTWFGRRGDASKHLASDCACVPIFCPHEGCGTAVARRDMAAHTHTHTRAVVPALTRLCRTPSHYRYILDSRLGTVP